MQAPNTIMDLYKCKDLHKKSKESIGPFKNYEQQYKFFNDNYFRRQFVALSYQRPTLGVVQLEASREELEEYSYLSFKNNVENDDHRYYAFITGVEFVSENVSNLYYEIDKAQTYLVGSEKDMNCFKFCYVEREHTDDDDIINVLADYEVSNEYAYETLENVKTKQNCLVIITNNKITDAEGENYWSRHLISNIDFSLGNEYGLIVNGVVNATNGYIYGIDVSTETYAAEFLHKFYTVVVQQGQTVKIIAMYQAYLAGGASSYAITPGLKQQNLGFRLSGYKEHDFPSLVGNDSYTPYNNKAYTYPYKYAFINNGENEVIMQEEYFPTISTTNEGTEYKTKDIEFNLYSSVWPQPAVILSPEAYKGNPAGCPDFNYCSVISRQTNIQYIADAAEEFVRQNQSGINEQKFFSALEVIGNTLSLVASQGTSATQVGANLMEIGGGLYRSYKEQSIQAAKLRSGPQPVRGAATPSVLFTAADYGIEKIVGNETQLVQPTNEQLFGNGFWYGRKTIPAEEMIIIDQLWQAYGYPVRRYKIPNLTSRKYWNYIQTKDCVLDTDWNSEIENELALMMDEGFTLWHPLEIDGRLVPPANMNNYTMYNDILPKNENTDA